MESLRNPVEVVRKPKLPNGRDRRLVGEEERWLLRSARESSLVLESIIIVALGTAMPLGELLKLSWNDIDLERRVAKLSDTKNGEVRRVPLSSLVVRTLRILPRAI